MAQHLTNFWKEEQGQDLIEYTLLITFIVMAVFAFLGAGRPAVNAIWQSGNSRLTDANTAANGG